MQLPPDVVAYQLAHKNDNIGYRLITTSVVFGCLALLCVTGRIFSRHISPGPFGTDDVLVVVAMFFGIALVVTASMMGTLGIGRHLVTVQPEEFLEFGKVNLALQTAYPFTIGFARLSILALYYRLFNKTGRLFLWALWACVVYNILFMIGVFLVVYLQCHPLHTIWTDSCTPKWKTTVSTSILNIVGDGLVLLLPQPILWGLTLPMRRKLGISIIMFFGIFTVVISIARIFILRNGKKQGHNDITYTSINTFIFTVVEPMTAIICSCLPVMLPVLRIVFSSIRGMSIIKIFTRTGRSTSHIGLTKSPSNEGAQSEYIRMAEINQGLGQAEVHALGFDFQTSALDDQGIWVSRQALVNSKQVV